MIYMAYKSFLWKKMGYDNCKYFKHFFALNFILFIFNKTCLLMARNVDWSLSLLLLIRLN